MMGFEYGVYQPGDFAAVEGCSKWKEIASYDSEIVNFIDGSTAFTDDVKQVRMIRDESTN